MAKVKFYDKRSVAKEAKPVCVCKTPCLWQGHLGPQGQGQRRIVVNVDVFAKGLTHAMSILKMNTVHCTDERFQARYICLWADLNTKTHTDRRTDIKQYADYFIKRGARAGT